MNNRILWTISLKKHAEGDKSPNKGGFLVLNAVVFRLLLGSTFMEYFYCAGENSNSDRSESFKLAQLPNLVLWIRDILVRIRIHESIPPAYVAWRVGTTTLFLLGS